MHSLNMRSSTHTRMRTSHASGCQPMVHPVHQRVRATSGAVADSSSIPKAPVAPVPHLSIDEFSLADTFKTVPLERAVAQTPASTRQNAGLPAPLFDGKRLRRHAVSRLQSLSRPIDRYMYLRDLQLFNPALYYSVLMEYTDVVMPYVYTPTVGEACQRYHTLPIPCQGLFLSLKDKGQIMQKLLRCVPREIRVIVVTDGERILGLGDLGSNGMGISEGKIQLYTALGGVDPSQCLPVCIDLGTNNEALLADPLYRGLRQKKITGQLYDEFLQEFMDAVKAWQPHILLQFEDFGNTNAFRLLDRYRERQCCFNDDIQGTACVTLAGILAALRASGQRLEDQRILFHGAGEAGTGIGELFAKAVAKQTGMSMDEARKHCFFMDSKGLVCKSRKGLQHHKEPFAHDVPPQPDLRSAVKALKPTILIGVSTISKAFTEEIVRDMASFNKDPIIFPLSNPTSKSECTYEEAFKWTEGRVVFASGSPFEPITTPDGVTHYPAQANNAYVFPAVGHAAVLTRCHSITDDVFLVAAETLAAMSPKEDLVRGYLFPPFTGIAAVSKELIARVAEHMVKSGGGTKPANMTGNSWECFAESQMWQVAPGSEGSKL